MATTATTTIVQFDLGRVMQRTFGSIGRNFGVFFLLALLLTGLPAALTGSVLAAAGGSNTSTHGVSGDGSAEVVAIGLAILGLVFLVGAVAGFVLQAAIIYGVVADLNGRRAGFGECLSTGLRHWFWLLLLAIVVTLGEFLGYMLFIVPGVMLATAWMVAVPVQVVESTGVFDSMGRSAALTRGHRWAIFGLIIIYLIAAGMFQGAIVAGIGSVAVSASATLGASLTKVLIQPLVSVATTLVAASGVASIYYELRSGREGIGPEALAAVFD